MKIFNKIKDFFKNLKNKIKPLLLKIFPYLNLFVIIIDIFVASILANDKNKTLQLIGLVYIGFILFRFGKSIYLVLKSRSQALNYLSDNRVVGIKGKQRVGKTSLSCYFLSVLGGDLYTNTPIKIGKKFTNKVTTNIISGREQIDDYSTIYIDECNLFYNNMYQTMSKNNPLIFGQSAFEQLVGHFTDGNIIYSSTNIDRMPAEIRENLSCELQVLEQYSYNYSFLGSMLLRWVYGFFDLKVYTGLRRWTAQHFERITNDNYMYDLSSNVKESHTFAQLFEFACFNNPLKFQYNDRYMSGLYKVLPAACIEKWEKTKFTYEDLHTLYDSKILQYFLDVYEESIKENKTFEALPSESEE